MTSQILRGENKMVETLYEIKVKLPSLKMGCFIYKMLYVSHLVITRQKPTVDSQKRKKEIKGYY